MYPRRGCDAYGPFHSPGQAVQTCKESARQQKAGPMEPKPRDLQDRKQKDVQQKERPLAKAVSRGSFFYSISSQPYTPGSHTLLSRIEIHTFPLCMTLSPVMYAFVLSGWIHSGIRSGCFMIRREPSRLLLCQRTGNCSIFNFKIFLLKLQYDPSVLPVCDEDLPAGGWINRLREREEMLWRC